MVNLTSSGKIPDFMDSVEIIIIIIIIIIINIVLFMN